MDQAIYCPAVRPSETAFADLAIGDEFVWTGDQYETIYRKIASNAARDRNGQVFYLRNEKAAVERVP